MKQKDDKYVGSGIDKTTNMSYHEINFNIQYSLFDIRHSQSPPFETREGKGMQKFDLEDRLVNFSVSITEVVESLPDTRLGNHIAGQLLRSGTAPAPNYGEAQGAESRRDFIHRMKIALKELRETFVWLKVIQRKHLVEDVTVLHQTLTENNELIAIVVACITTTQRNLMARKTTNSEQGMMK
ncbi:MAG: four helix bundle protein [Ignavibacteria bacterium]|nr:four helix bundle protein [Ignavibacteria bacterium]